MLIPAETKQLLRALIKWHNAMRHSLNCGNKSRQTNHLDHRNPFNSINAQAASELGRLKACAVRSLVGLGVKFCLKPRARGKKEIRGWRKTKAGDSDSSLRWRRSWLWKERGLLSFLMSECVPAAIRSQVISQRNQGAVRHYSLALIWIWAPDDFSWLSGLLGSRDGR